MGEKKLISKEEVRLTKLLLKKLTKTRENNFYIFVAGEG
jgi:hypothetical protein